MKIGEMFPSRYLRAADVPDEGDLILTIQGIDVETVGQGANAEEKPLVMFRETEKALVLNKTNANAIAGLHGDDTDQWAGKRIALFATEVDFQGKQTLALRVRLKAPKPAAQARERMAVAAGAGRGPQVDDEADSWDQ